MKSWPIQDAEVRFGETLDAFLKERGVYTDDDHADLMQDLRDLDRLGL